MLAGTAAYSFSIPTKGCMSFNDHVRVLCAWGLFIDSWGEKYSMPFFMTTVKETHSAATAIASSGETLQFTVRFSFLEM